MLALPRALNENGEMKERDDAAVLSSELSTEREPSPQELLIQ